MSNDKDIYEVLNDIEFDITSEMEIPMDDIKKKKLKKQLKSSVRSTKMSKILKIALVASLAVVFMLVSPMGGDVVAKIKEALFFNPGLGVVSTNEEVYVLKEPIATKIDGKEVLIKSVISKENEVSIGIWIEYSSNSSKIEEEKYINSLKDKFSIRLPNGELIKTDMYSIGSGGIRSSFNQSYKTEGIVKEFTLVSDNKDVISISLVEGDKLYKYSDVGGNSKDSGIMIGGNKYIFEGDTYIYIWNKEDINIQSNIFYPKDYFSISDDKGKTYNVNSSTYSGQGNEFVIDGEVRSNLNININRVEVDYNLVNMPKIKVKIPEKGETIEINKEIYLEDIDEKILLKSIKGTEESVELYFDVKKFKKEDSQIVLLNASFRNHGCIGSADGSPIIMSFDYEDLKLSEKITGSLNFELGGVDLYKVGDWNFTIK
ncbi:hypothetical protein [Clostridium paraputrificum]|uniref:DUF4179 domain-containing protein n=1 Tax=Clostridium paraputrificum TaxID=29363 RepID=A0A6N3DW89_9CLOT